MSMNPITDKQLGWMSHYILREIEERLDQYREPNVNRTIQHAEQWCKENLDIGTTSDIIGMWKNGDKELAINQLRHLGLNIT